VPSQHRILVASLALPCHIPCPAAFNLFVKEKLEEFKQRGVKDPADTGTNNGLFK
jgi:hypothetical protein